MRYTILVLLLITSFCPAQEMIWARNGLEDSSGYGTWVYSLGDLNEDGFFDFAIGAFALNYSRHPFGGYLEMFYGGQSPNLTPFRRLLPDTAAGLKYGTFRVLGDINGDGVEDWAGYMRQRSNVSIVVAQIYFDGFSDTLPDLEWQFRDQILYSMGDFNGDGFDDIYRYYESPLDYGEVYFGTVNFDTIPDWTMHSPEGHRYQAWPDAFGDLNGDGYVDFVSGNPTPENQLHIFYGGVSPDTVPAAVWTNHRDWETRIIEDLNGDGKDEIVWAGLPVGNINVHFGGSTISQTPSRTLQFLGCPDVFDILSAGDVNDDGYNDMIVIDWNCTLGGKLALYLGSPWLNPNPVYEFLGTRDPYDLVAIFSAAGLGDVNGDEVGDFGVGAWSNDTEGTRGRAIVIAGTRNWIVPADDHRAPYPRDFQVSAFPNPFNSQTILRMDLPLGTRNVKVSVFNTLGQRVEQFDAPVSANRVDVRLSADNWSSGVYLAQVQTESALETLKLVLLK